VTGDQAIRPGTDESGTPFAIDMGSCLTSDHQALWDEHFGGLKQWACGSIWQVTLMELWSFDQICMLEAGNLPAYPPEIRAQVGELAMMLGEYLRNIRTGRKPDTAT
jgi:hypothetical protein